MGKGKSMQISISVEAQNGLTWAKWERYVKEVEALGYAGLYRSDHFPNEHASLELVTSLTYLAQNTERIHFSPLVTPLSFQHPVMLARQAAAIDDLSQGRLILGLGAGWEPNEHEQWGYPLGDKATRLHRFEEGLEIITRLLRSDEPVTFEGQYFQLKAARLLPRPQRSGGPPIMIGGNGRKRTLPLTARFADIHNSFHQTPESIREYSAHLDALLLTQGRQPENVKRTVMLLVYCGQDDAEIKARARSAYETWAPQVANEPFDRILETLQSGLSGFLATIGATFCPVVGTPEEVVAQLQAYADVGIEEVIMQWFDVDDFEGIHKYAEYILPYI